MRNNEELDELLANLSEDTRECLVDLRDPHKVFSCTADVRVDLLSAGIAQDASSEMPGYSDVMLLEGSSRRKMLLNADGILVFLRIWNAYVEKHDVTRYHEIPALLNEALHQKLTPKIVESCRHLQLEATFKCEVTENDDQQLMKVYLHCQLCGSRLSFVGLPEEVFSEDKREFRVLFSMTPQQYELREEEKPSEEGASGTNYGD